MNIRLRQLKAFLTIADTGSVTKAADILGFTQSNVSKLLAGFENELGFRLFERHGRRLRLSEQGRAFLRQARHAIETLEDIRRVAEDIRDNQGRRLRISAIGPMVSGQVLPRALASFSRGHPDFSYSLEQKTRFEIEDWVMNGHSEIGFTLLPVGHSQLASRALPKVRAVVALPKGHRFADLPFVSASELAQEDLIVPWSRARIRVLTEAEFLHSNLKLDPKFETTSANSAAQLVAQGAGVSLLDPFTLTGIPEDMIDIVAYQPEISLTYGMIWAGNRTPTPHEFEIFDDVVEAMRGMSHHSHAMRR